MNMKISETESKIIYYAKAIAIFCVICAHSTPLAENSGKISQIASSFLNYLGTIGVPVFYLISGYLFEKNQKSSVVFWKGKVWSLFIPWLFCESLLWFYVVIRSGDISVGSWLLFIVGYKHTTYYMTVLVVFYLIFYWLRSDWVLIIASVLSIISIISQGWQTGIVFINEWTGTYYLNPLNWMVFFCAGIWISRHLSLEKIGEKLRKVIPILLCVSVAYFLWMTISDEMIYYFSRLALIPLLVNTLLVIALAYRLTLKSSGNQVKAGAEPLGAQVIAKIGAYSYTIYLLHQFFAGIVVKITSLIDFFLIVLTRPFIILVLTMIVITILNKLKGNAGVLLRRLCGIR